MYYSSRFLVLIMLVGEILLSSQSAMATLASHAPSLSVHESLYGIETRGTQRLSVEKITIRLHSHVKWTQPLVVQSFFFKKVNSGDAPKINDIVVFELMSPNACYEVTALPIKISGAGNPSKKASSKPHRMSKNSATNNPRDGFIVRLLCDGIVLRIHASSHALEHLATKHPEVLNHASNKKSVRHVEADDLLKK